MKNRKTIIVAFVLCAALLMGIGYAALTGHLSVTTDITLNPNNDDLNVVFLKDECAIEAGQEDLATLSLNTGEDGKDATLKITGLHSQGDEVTANFTIKNKTDDVTATVKLNQITNQNPDNKYEIEHTFDAAGVGADATRDDTITLAAGESYTFSVTITLKNTVLEYHTHNFSINFKTDSVAA